jgi:signal transduction histidine kinase
MASVAMLLHDDEPTLALIRRVVEDAGFSVSVVQSAFKAVTTGAPSARFVVLGVSAVDERDMEVVSALRSRSPDAFILALFPAALRERAALALTLGADASLPEPFYPGELAAIARRVAQRLASADAALEAGASRSAAPSVRAGVVEQLAAGVAHSIRNPLQILELQLSSADADGTVDAPGMREQFQRIANVVDGLAKFSGHRNLSMRPFDLNPLVAQTFAAGAPAAADAPKFSVSLCEGAAEVLAAPEVLRTGLEHLRDRAERVTPAGGRIEVSTRFADIDDGRVVEIAVTDGGPAMPAERRARLFEPYPDVDAIQEGTGLDLAALAGIVRDHGGTVAALAGPAGGTTIVVRLPARSESERSGISVAKGLRG